MTDRFAANRGADIVRWYAMAANVDEQKAAERILVDVAAWAKENSADLAAQPVAVFDGYLDGGAAVIQWRGKALPAGALLYAEPVTAK